MSTDIFQISPTFYGITMVPKDSWREYGYALLTIAGSDGDVSDPELEWLTIECAQAVGVDESMIADWEEFDFEEGDLEEIFYNFNSSSFANFNKLLIYDAIRMSSADGDYAQDEREQVHHAAQILKVPMDSVMAIEALVDLEHAANKLRLTIF
ncbi:hypothetical protein [Ekhidna sp.]|jgi:uncharacterized tellurite resistance protein B-like protein|uniref:hypothetical protein n=1 Tax=Ekhidna sp. TaxID=2608089 RepID=UPI0032EB61EE